MPPRNVVVCLTLFAMSVICLVIIVATVVASFRTTTDACLTFAGIDRAPPSPYLLVREYSWCYDAALLKTRTALVTTNATDAVAIVARINAVGIQIQPNENYWIPVGIIVAMGALIIGAILWSNLREPAKGTIWERMTMNQ